MEESLTGKFVIVCKDLYVLDRKSARLEEVFGEIKESLIVHHVRDNSGQEKKKWNTESVRVWQRLH